MTITVAEALTVLFFLMLAITCTVLIIARSHNKEMQEFWENIEQDEEYNNWINQQKP